MPRTPRKPTRKQPAHRDLTAAEFGDALKAAGIKALSFDPLQSLALILKMVLKDRITDKEIKLICETHHRLIKEIWGKEKRKPGAKR